MKSAFISCSDKVKFSFVSQEMRVHINFWTTTLILWKQSWPPPIASGRDKTSSPFPTWVQIWGGGTFEIIVLSRSSERLVDEKHRGRNNGSVNIPFIFLFEKYICKRIYRETFYFSFLSEQQRRRKSLLLRCFEITSKLAF